MNENEELRNGYTTGSCAAAAVKACILSLNKKNNFCEKVNINALNDEKISIKIEKVIRKKNRALAFVKKYAGDDPDVTNGISICARVKIVERLKKNNKAHFFDKCSIVGGVGVGIVTKKGLQVEVGKSAINPGPLKMINEVVEEYLTEENKKVEIIIFVPEGKDVALKTYNPKMGILNGISILGTTGIVKPMSEDALKKSMFAELKVIKEDGGKDWVIFIFGNYGLSYFSKLGINTEQSVVISNYVGFMIESAVKLGFKKIILIGHISKCIKIAGGIFNTHSRVADARFEIMASNAFLLNEPTETIQKILNSNTIEEACEYITDKKFYNFISNKIAQKIKEYSRADIDVEVAIFSFKDEIIGESDNYKFLLNNIKNEENL